MEDQIDLRLNQGILTVQGRGEDQLREKPLNTEIEFVFHFSKGRLSFKLTCF